MGIFVSLGLIDPPKQVEEKKDAWTFPPLDSVAIKDKLENLLSFTSSLREKIIRGQNAHNGDESELPLEDGEFSESQEAIETEPIETQPSQTINETVRIKLDSFLSFTNGIKAKLILPELTPNQTNHDEFESQPSSYIQPNGIPAEPGSNGVGNQPMPSSRQSVYFQVPQLEARVPEITSNLSDKLGDVYNKTNAFVGRLRKLN